MPSFQPHAFSAEATYMQRSVFTLTVPFVLRTIFNYRVPITIVGVLVEKKRPNLIDVHVGDRVRTRRLALGMTQQKLAAALGLTFQQVQKYEKGANRIGASRLQHISGILQIPVEHFFHGMPGQQRPKGNAPSSTYVSDFLATEGGLALAKAFTKIKHAKIRHQIAKLVKEIAGG